MLKVIFPGQLQLGLTQAVAAAIIAFAVVLLARRRQIHLESDAAIAMLRGLVQIVAVGSVLVLLLRGPRWSASFLLVAMILAAAATSARRAKGIPCSFRVSTYSIATSRNDALQRGPRSSRTSTDPTATICTRP